MDPFRKVSRGDRRAPSAAMHNATVDAVREWLRSRPRNQVSGVPASKPPLDGAVLVRNDDSIVLSQWYTPRVSGVVVGPENEHEFATQPCLNVVRHTSFVSGVASDDVGAVLLQPLAAGAIGWAVMSGVTPALVSVSSTSHRWADIEQSLGGGLLLATLAVRGQAEIVWKPSGTGQLLCIVRMGARG